MPAMKMEAFYGTVLAPRLAQLFRDALREVLGVQAPVILLGSVKLVAATPATPGAPPRMVTHNLRNNIVVRGNKVYINMPYGAYLEADGHKFINRAIRLVREWSRAKRISIR